MPSSPTDPLRPRASRCWTVVGRSGALDLEVTARDDEPLGAVLVQVGGALGIGAGPVFSGATRLPDDLPLTDVRLRHGAVLGLGHPVDDGAGRRAPGALELRVVGGPDAGRSVPLGAGRHVVGRGADADLRLDDPDVSRRHALVHVARGAVEVTDLGSSNGTALDGRPLPGPTAWPGDALLHLGTTTLQVTAVDDAPAAVVGSTGGRTEIRPSVAIAEVRTPVEVQFPQPPAPAPPRRMAWLAVALPAVAGLALAVVLRTPTFLFFALLGPLAAVASWWSDRRSGRRTHRRELAEFRSLSAEAEELLVAAVRDDVRAGERRLPDLAALAAAAARRTSLLWTRSGSDPDLLTIRVGTGPGVTGVLRCAPDGSRAQAPAEHVPVPVDLRAGGLGVIGPRARTLGVLRSAVTQLAALHPPDRVELVLLTSAARLPDWRWARWLPHLRLRPLVVPEEGASTTPPGRDAIRAVLALLERGRAARSVGGRPWPGPWTAVVVDGHLPGPVAAELAGGADVGLTLLSHAPTATELPVRVPAVVTVDGELGTHGRLQVRGAASRDRIALDQLPPDVAAQVARNLAGLSAASGRSALPADVRFLDVAAADGTRGHGSTAERWSRDRGSLGVPLGVGTDGVERIDLCRDGPHVLVAGTTGAGKSELLQTLVAGLALAHPPDRCSFLLVDYKGGAAFGEAAALPHTVGLLTDLDDSATTRALRSLTAELTRRERLLSKHGVGDIAELPDDVPLARLVIVVDEFATLAEELPSFVPGLVGIAQRGRSLGIHLVLATQRPAGVVSADIRANCTLRICLRTTDEADSRDVLGTPDAGQLPVDRPGRAVLRIGTGSPRQLQVARVSRPAPRHDDAPMAAPWCWPAPPARPLPTTDAESDLAALVRNLGERARNLGSPSPHRPWRAPLPTSLTVDAAEALTSSSGRSRTQLVLGLLDRPDRQEQHPLVLDLAAGGGWLAVGGPRSGRTTLLQSVLNQAVSGSPPDRLHVHVVDRGGGALASAASSMPCVGTAIAGDHPLRTVRLVHRLGEEVARRRSAPSVDDPALLLLVDGVESLCALLDDADPARGSAELLRLVRDGAAVGLTCVLTAERAVPGGRLAGMAQHRLVLPLPDRADYAVAGVPLAAVPSTRPPGRAIVGEDAVECQLVLPPPLEARAPRAGSADARRPPLRIVDLEPDPIVDGALEDRGRASLNVAIGPGDDEGGTLRADLLRTGGLLVMGPAGSGRSATLEAIVGDLLHAAVPVLRLQGPMAPARADTGGDEVDRADATATADWLDAHRGGPVVVHVDDLGPVGGAAALTALPQLGPGSGVALLAAGAAADVATWFQGPVGALRRSRSGLLLTPAPGDADVLGVRLPRTPVPVRPGSGWLVSGGTARRVQVARHRGRPTRGHSSSSTGPISCVAYQASS